jgi:hypothetical protein
LLKVESNNGQMVFSRVNIPILSNLLLGMVDLFVLSAWQSVTWCLAELSLENEAITEVL